MSGWGMSISGLSSVISIIEQIQVDFGNDGTVYLVGPTTNYAVHHEFGTSKMEARPFMRPAAERVRSNLNHHIRKISTSQGIPLTSEEAVVRCAALAVETEAKKIADRKDVRDSGTTIASIQARRA